VGHVRVFRGDLSGWFGDRIFLAAASPSKDCAANVFSSALLKHVKKMSKFVWHHCQSA
jgi:hypothetical protein